MKLEIMFCASQQLPLLRSKRFHHSSMVVRKNLFVFFGSTHRKGHGSVPCMKFEYLPLNGNQYEFKEIDCDWEGNIDSKYLVLCDPLKSQSRQYEYKISNKIVEIIIFCEGTVIFLL